MKNPSSKSVSPVRRRVIKLAIIAAIMLIFAGAVLLFGVYCNYAIGSCRQYCYDDVEQIPARETALLLGAAKITPSGKPNLYFAGRIAAAVKLFHAGKIKHIIISGDNSRKDYNEPQDMKNSLLEQGIPESAMTLDYAGFRTLDSVVRAKNVFKKDALLIISQPGHTERAVYIARKHGIDAAAFNAGEPVHFKWLVERNRKREKYACIAAWLDLNILHRKPKFEQ